jgi:hypothetical protein
MQLRDSDRRLCHVYVRELCAIILQAADEISRKVPLSRLGNDQAEGRRANDDRLEQECSFGVPSSRWLNEAAARSG